jgi:hypothetical protein
VHIKFKDWPLKQPLIASNSQKNPSAAQSTGHGCPGKKALGCISFFFFFFKLFHIVEDRASTRIVTHWTPNPWKTSLPHAMPNPVPGSACLEKSSMLLLPYHQFQSCCANLQNQQGNNMHLM